MEPITDYTLFLFDLDGLLVNTEELHFKAYRRMCAHRGFTLTWDWPTYARAAHHNATGMREAIYKEFPDLQRREPCWDILYREKKAAYVNLLQQQGVELMPGVADLLKQLDTSGVKRAVVTHSPKEQVDRIRAAQPVLNTIPHWFTREDYIEPKPSPDGYLTAIKRLGEADDKIVGFEDSPRGLKALLATDAQAVLVSSVVDPQAVKALEGEFTHIPTFASLDTQL